MSIYFTKKRTLKQLLRIVIRKVRLALTYIPFRLTAYKRTFPDFIIIGVLKAGTTSLFKYLDHHPDVEMSRVKEVNYFSYHYFRSNFFYKSFFPYKSQNMLSGEASPYYFIHPWVPERIKKDFPHTKLILLLRDPVLRAYSHYNQIRKIEPADSFDEVIRLESDRLKAIDKKLTRSPYSSSLKHQTFSYINTGFYYKHLSNWLKHYRKEELLILKSEDFFNNPKDELKKVYQFLELKEIYPKDLSPKNQRLYDGLSKGEYRIYKKLFSEDGQKLKELLGDHFSW